ncbi:MAG: hypothetical protein ACKO2G_12355 [Verrucomicrobiales bacterium]
MLQTSREAIIELLFLSLYLDDHLSMAEDAAIETALLSLGWASEKPKEICILNAFASARNAAASNEATRKFLDERVSVIQNDGQESVALEWLGKVLAADGLTQPEERFLHQLHDRLFPKR